MVAATNGRKKPEKIRRAIIPTEMFRRKVVREHCSIPSYHSEPSSGAAISKVPTRQVRLSFSQNRATQKPPLLRHFGG
jgi:hypothetical protein